MNSPSWIATARLAVSVGGKPGSFSAMDEWFHRMRPGERKKRPRALFIGRPDKRFAVIGRFGYDRQGSDLEAVHQL
ncbi:hypothetical protein, partial [Pseudomonas aeruginosa]|uniref:hypothetical protein n=1 Tax=Pseudomonas aeruginosa TaxID=287 RepID=UPI0019D025BE